MRKLVAAVSLISFFLLTSACQTNGSKAVASPRPSSPIIATPGPASTPSPTASPAPPSPAGSAAATLPPPPAPGPLSTAQLTIAGSTTSRIDSTQSRGPCGAAPVGYAAALAFRMDGQPYVLSIAIADYHGPDQYAIPPERVSLHTETGAASPTLAAAVSGSVTVNSDERSGSIDVQLSDRSRVSGTWACGT